MITLNAKKAMPMEGDTVKDERFLIPNNSPLHRFLENSLLPYKLNLNCHLALVIEAHDTWSHSYEEAKVAVIRIVFLHGKCIVAKREVGRPNLRHLKEKECMKLAHLQHLLEPHTEKLETTIEMLRSAITKVQVAHKEIVSMMPVPGLAEIVFHHKWNVRRFVSVISKMIKALKWELKMRIFVRERIIETMNREELYSCRSFWQELHETPEILEFKKIYNDFEREINGESTTDDETESDDEKPENDDEKTETDDEETAGICVNN